MLCDQSIVGFFLRIVKAEKNKPYLSTLAYEFSFSQSALLFTHSWSEKEKGSCLK